MAGEPEETLPDELQRWVDERAAASDVDAEEIVSRAVTLYRLVEEHATTANDEMPVDDITADLEHLTDRIGEFDTLENDLDTLTDRVADLDDRVGTVEGDLDTKVADVRERIIQVKREADGKAPRDHDHEELHDRVDNLETRFDTGFENYEEVLSYLTDEAEELDEKLTRVAQVVVSLRRRTATVEQRTNELDAAADLKRAANRQGVTKAKCGECGESVALGLLTEPACPHCDSSFVDVEPPGRMFGSAILLTGRPPALMPGDEPTDASQNGQHTAPKDSAAELLEESKNA